MLRNHAVLGEFYLDVIPQGSFAHRTIIKPFGNREYDADILLSMKEHPDWTPGQYTQELYKAFDGSARYKGMAHRRTRCVYIDYADEFHIDVVPYVESRTSITNNKTDDWEYTDPEGFTAWLEGKTRATGGRLPAVLRMLKYLRDSKGNLLDQVRAAEDLVGERVDAWHADIDDGYYGDIPTTLVNIIEDLDQRLRANPWLPAIYDPAGTGQDFSKRWDQDGYVNFRTQIRYYAAKIRDAYDEQDKDASIIKWQSVFGPGFCAPAPADELTASVVSKADNRGEQFIDADLNIPVRLTETVRLVGRVRRAGVQRSYELPRRFNRVGKGSMIDFSIADYSVAGPYQVY